MNNNSNETFTYEQFKLFKQSIPILLKMYNASNYDFVFFGGEPTLNWEVNKQIILDLNQDKNKNQILFITNAILLDEEKIDFLCENNVHLSISYDGPLLNNRKLYQGKTYQIFDDEKMKMLSKFSGFKVMLSPDNFNNDPYILIKTFEYFMQFRTTPDFTIVRDNIWDDNSIHNFETALSLFKDYLIDNCESIIVEPFNLMYRDILLYFSQGKRPFSCFAGNKGVGVFNDGKIYACARFGTNHKDTWIYDYKNNSINKEQYEFFNNEEIFNPKLYKKCFDCEIRNFCNGGCLYSQIMTNNKKPLDSVCKLKKIIFKNTVDLINARREYERNR